MEWNDLESKLESALRREQDQITLRQEHLGRLELAEKQVKWAEEASVRFRDWRDEAWERVRKLETALEIIARGVDAPNAYAASVLDQLASENTSEQVGR